MKHSMSITIFLVVLFLAAQYIGLGVVHSYIDVETTQQTGNLTVYDLPSVAGVKMDRPQMEENVSVIYIIVAVLIGTGIILLLIKFGRFDIWKIWFLIVAAMCLTFAFGSRLSPVIASILGIAFAVWKVYKPNFIIHNFTELFIYGGLAAMMFPILSVWGAVILLLAISVYDMYAVWKSKHMVTLATSQQKEGMFAGLVVPYSFKTSMAPKQSVSSTSSSASAKQPSKQRVPSSDGQTAILGGGDIGFPLLFAAAILKQSVVAGTSVLPAFIVPVFAAVALFLLLTYAKKDRFYPAMPFITAGCLVGWMVSFLI